MTWEDRLNAIKLGDQVRYSRRWVRENHKSETELLKAKGVVTGFEDHNGIKLASVTWDKPDIPDLVNVLNLVHVKKLGVADE